MKKTYFELPPSGKDAASLFLRKHIGALNDELSRLSEGIKKELYVIRTEASAASSRQDSMAVELVHTGGRLDTIEADLNAIHEEIEFIWLQLEALRKAIDAL